MTSKSHPNNIHNSHVSVRALRGLTGPNQPRSG